MSAMAFPIPCAHLVTNEDGEMHNYLRPAAKICGGCKLVRYCSKGCQSAHWPTHKADCKSEMASDAWKPSWEVERREPTFVTDGSPYESYGPLKYLWGNTPAIDVIKLMKNEGGNYTENLSVCFAASGDIRHVVTTVNALPETYSGSLNVHINDCDLDVVVRSIILLILALSDASDGVVDCMIHLWYSAMLTKDHYETMKKLVRPQVAYVVGKITHKLEEDILGKTFQIGSSSVRVILKKVQWLKVLEVLDRELDADKAIITRREIVLHRVDHLHRDLFAKPNYHRVSKMKFWQSGILLPFGASAQAFTIPNPTLFDQSWHWMQKDSANPLAGWWTTGNGLLTESGEAPANDIYGHLHTALYHRLSAFNKRCQAQPVHFTLMSADIQSLTNFIPPTIKFDRIDVSNVMDLCYLGVNKTLESVKPFLRTTNQHACILALFMNAVMGAGSNRKQAVMPRLLRQTSQYLPFQPAMMSNPNSAKLMQLICATDLLLPCDEWFAEYSQIFRVNEQARFAGFGIRAENKILEAWPWRFVRGPNAALNQQSFLSLLASSCTGIERYTEWVLASD